MLLKQPSRIFFAVGQETFTYTFTTERPLKRQRDSEDEGDGGDGPAMFMAQPPVHPVPDDDFYFANDVRATCFVQVGAVLFKIHEDIFNICANMVKELVNHVNLKGPTTVQSPLIISYMSAHQYRTMLWAIYHNPVALYKSAHLQDEHYIPRVLTLFTFVQSLTSETLKIFTYKALDDAAKNVDFIMSCQSSTLSALLEHFKTRDAIARDALVDNWIKRLREEKNSFVPAILAASKLGINRLRGVACYMYLREISGKVKNSDNPYSAMHLTIDDKLEAEHVPWLLQGYFSLTNLSQRLRHNPIPLPKGEGCSEERHEKCVAVWKDRWAVISRYANITALPPADILFLVRDMRASFISDEEARIGLTADCRLEGLQAMQSLLEELGDPDVLASHFVIKKAPVPE